MSMITRRGLVRAAGLALCAGALSGVGDMATSGLAHADEHASAPVDDGSPQPEAKDALDILVMTDPHFLSPRLNDHGDMFQQVTQASDGKVMEYSEQILDAFVWEVLRTPPDVVVITGDLTYNGALQSHEDLVAKLDLIREAGIPVVVFPGNHDVNCPYAARFKGETYEYVPSATPADFERFYAPFGYDDARARDEASLSYVWESACTLSGRPVRLLMVDVNGVEAPAAVPASTLAWVDAQLEQAVADDAIVVAFSHQNLLQQAFIAATFSIDNAADLQQIYESRPGTPVANFSGHLHFQRSAASKAGLVDMATSSLAVWPNQFARLRLTSQALTYDTEQLDVSAWAAAMGIDDPNLLDFASFAWHFFRDRSYISTLAGLQEAGLPDAEELATFSADTSDAWFSGRLDTIDLQTAEPLIARWREISPLSGMHYDYIFHQTPIKDDNHLLVALK